MLGIALVHAILMTIFVADLVSRQKTFLGAQSIEQTEALANSLSANSVSWVLADDVIGLEELVLSLKDYPGIEYAMVLSPEGEVLGHTDNSLVGLYVNDPVSLGLLDAVSGIRHLVNNDDLLDTAAPIYSDREHIGWARVAISKSALNTSLQKIMRDGIGYTFIAIIVGSFFAIAMARGITFGIRQLLRVTRQVESGNIDAHVENERPDELGKLGAAFNLMIDTVRQSIEELKHAQQITLEEKEKAQAYLNTAMVAFLVLDMKGRVVLANPYCLNILKYDESEIIGKKWFETFVFPPDRKVIEENYGIHFHSQTLSKKPFELRVLARTGDVRLMEFRSTTLFDARGEAIGILWSGHDITEKKEVEAELEKYRKHLETLVRERTVDLENALENIKTLKGIIPICSHCKQIRDDSGYWNQLEAYLAEHSEADFSHGICPDCMEKLYPDYKD
jgi:PAS domain S-box-containing protein